MATEQNIILVAATQQPGRKPYHGHFILLRSETDETPLWRGARTDCTRQERVRTAKLARNRVDPPSFRSAGLPHHRTCGLTSCAVESPRPAVGAKDISPNRWGRGSGNGAAFLHMPAQSTRRHPIRSGRSTVRLHRFQRRFGWLHRLRLIPLNQQVIAHAGHTSSGASPALRAQRLFPHSMHFIARARGFFEFQVLRVFVHLRFKAFQYG